MNIYGLVINAPSGTERIKVKRNITWIHGAGSHLFYSSHELFAVTVIFSGFHHQLAESLNSEGRAEQAQQIILMLTFYNLLAQAFILETLYHRRVVYSREAFNYDGCLFFQELILKRIEKAMFITVTDTSFFLTRTEQIRKSRLLMLFWNNLETMSSYWSIHVL